MLHTTLFLGQRHAGYKKSERFRFCIKYKYQCIKVKQCFGHEAMIRIYDSDMIGNLITSNKYH